MVAQRVKNLSAMLKRDREDPLKKGMAMHSSILSWRIPWEFHGQRSLAAYSPRGYKESNTTRKLTLSLSQICKYIAILFSGWPSHPTNIAHSIYPLLYWWGCKWWAGFSWKTMWSWDWKNKVGPGCQRSHLLASLLWATIFTFFFFFLLMSGVICICEARRASQVVLVVKNLPANAGDLGDMG